MARATESQNIIGAYHFYGCPGTIFASIGWITGTERPYCPTCLYSWFCVADQEYAGLGLEDRDRRVPGNGREGGTGWFQLG
jgi:hypothetical protein